MTTSAFRSLQDDLDDRFLEADLTAVESALASLLEREAGRRDVRELIGGFAARVQTRVAEIFPQPFVIEVAPFMDGVSCGLPNHTTIFIPLEDVPTYWAILDGEAKRAQARGLDMMSIPDLLDDVVINRAGGWTGSWIPVAAAIDAAQKLKAFF